MLPGIPCDADGIPIISRTPNLDGFKSVTNTTEVKLSSAPTDNSFFLQRLHCFCTAAGGGAAGNWELRNGAGGTVIYTQPQFLAPVAGNLVIVDFPTPIEFRRAAGTTGNLYIAPAVDVGDWSIAAFGFYTKVQQIVSV